MNDAQASGRVFIGTTEQDVKAGGQDAGEHLREESRHTHCANSGCGG
jgi:hypothetical protein